MQDLAKLVGNRTNIHFQVKEVHSSDHEKTVVLEGSYSQDAVVLHLHDGWADTPVLPGHSLNLIAEKTRDADGCLHAVCNFEAGTPCSCCACACFLCLFCVSCNIRGFCVMCPGRGSTEAGIFPHAVLV